MRSDSFVDTNILIYAVAGARDYPGKWQSALDLLDAKRVCLSGQVLAEFYYNCVKKKLAPLDEAIEWLDYFSTLPCIPIDQGVVCDGAAISRRYQISYWDAALVAAAKREGVDTLYTEDLSHGQVYDGVRVINPFIEN